MPAKSAPSLLPTSTPLPAGSGSTFTLHHAHTPLSTPPRNQSAQSSLLLPLLLTPSLLHVTLAFSSGINAPTSDTIPEDCSRGCSIRSRPVTVRQSPCMAPMAYRDLTARLCTSRTANDSFCRAFGLPPCDPQQPRPPFHFARSQLHEAALTGSRHSTIPSTPDHPQMQCRVQPCTCSPQANHQSNKQTAQQRPPVAPFASLRYAFISLRR